MLTHVVLGDWNDIPDEEVIPSGRGSIAFQFLDDRALSSYLRRTVEQACAHGDMDALIVTGLTPAGLKVLQAYVDRGGIKSYFSFVPNFGTWKRLQRK